MKSGLVGRLWEGTLLPVAPLAALPPDAPSATIEGGRSSFVTHRCGWLLGSAGASALVAVAGVDRWTLLGTYMVALWPLWLGSQS